VIYRPISQACAGFIQGLIIHHLDGERLCGCAVPEGRPSETDACYVAEILARIDELDDRPLTEPR
jgi:hypothetical protein